MSVLRRNNVNVRGRGERALVFAHGFGCSQEMWRLVAPAFEEDFRVVLFDFVGFGGADRAAYDARRYSSLEGYAADVLEVCDALALRNVVFAGHSVASMIGVLAAIARPSLFSRLVLVGPSPCYLNVPPDYYGGFERADIDALLEMMERNYLGWASGFAPVVMGNADRPELGAELEKSFCSTDPRIAQQFARVTFLSDNRADLERVDVPSLILQCAQDAVAPPAVGEYVRSRLRGADLVMLPAAGHCPHMSHPGEVIRAMKAYLA